MPSTTNSTRMRTLFESVWDWLHRYAEYTELGLTEFRQFDGRGVPLDENGLPRFSSTEYPVIYTEPIEFLTQEDSVEQQVLLENFEVSIPMGVIYQAENADEGAADPAWFECLEAAMIVTDIFTTREAQRTGLGTSCDPINTVRVEMQNMDEIRQPESYRIDAYNCGFTLILGTSRVPVT